MSSFDCGLQFRVREGPDRGRSFPLDHREVTVGRARTAGDRAPGWVLINDPLVQRIHAEIAWDDKVQAFHLVSRSPESPVQVNGNSAREILLRLGDVIQIGATTLVLQAVTALINAEPRAASDATAEPKTIKMPVRSSKALEVVSGSRKGERLPLKGMKIQLGGSTNEAIPQDKQWWDQDLVIQDEAVPYRCMAWHWQEQERAFEVSMLRSVPVPVSFERSVDGVEWMSEMPSGMGAAVLVRNQDRILLGKTTLRLIVDEP